MSYRAKNYVPNPLGNDVAKWRHWKREVMGYLDNTNKGMKELLKDLEKHNESPTEV